MRSIAIGLLLISSMAQAGESPAFDPPDKAASSSQPAPTPWIACRLTVKRGTVPRSPDVTVYTGLIPRGQAHESDYNQSFVAFVEKTYGIKGGADCATANTEAQAQQNLDFWTTNKANPSQIQVVKTGWTHPAQ